MAVDIVMPQMGESIFEGTITKWLKKPGDKVERDEPLFEISTDKVDAEIPSPSAGVLKEIKVGEGQTVPIQTVVGVIDAAGSAAGAPSPAPSAPAPVKAAAPAAPQAAAPKTAPAPVAPPPASGASAAPSRPAAPPAAAPAPPGVSGAQAHVALETAVPREKIYFGHYEVQPMSTMRQRIAEHMVASKRVSAHVYSVDEIDMTKVAALRAKSKDEFEKRYETKLTFMPFFVKAAVAGLRAYPTLNASLDGTNVILHKEINVGIAVALDWGLLVPVVKNADEKNILGIQRNLNDLAERARSKKLKPEEVQESTFSITNPGVFGGLFGLPVISQPNVGILGLGAIEKRPVVINDSIAIRSMCYVTLSYDHRVVDGAIAHQFLHKVKETLENWNEPVL